MTARLDAIEHELVDCRKCARLTAWREEVARVKRRAYRDQDYWGKPVPGFGDPQARVLIVGLAPGAHGSNRTGRMFTGDSSGDFLYRALHRAGFASQPVATSREDGLTLTGVFISAVARCAPPDNRPTPGEISTCLPYLQAEIAALGRLEGVVALGGIAFEYSRKLFYGKSPAADGMQFHHGAAYHPGGGLPWLLASYHPSRQNTQTGRLTPEMFDQIWDAVRRNLEK